MSTKLSHYFCGTIYKDLFKKVKNAIAVYTSELDHSAEGPAPEVLLQDRLEKGRERLDDALEAFALLCEPIAPPQGELEAIHYFCGNTEIPADLQAREPQRTALYKATVALVRAYANLSDELQAAGYSGWDITRIKGQVDRAVKLRELIRQASGETLDLKAYEADMRHLIDTYIAADEPRKISPFDDMPLLELIVKTGLAEAIAQMPQGIRKHREAVSETIENNVRRKIIKAHLTDPAYFERMSALLDELIAARKAKAIEYEAYLRQIAELVKKVEAGHAEETPAELKTPGQRALYNNLNQDMDLALRIDYAVKQERPDAWRGNMAKENIIKMGLYDIFKEAHEVERIFQIIKQNSEY